ncbi:CCAAT/enhancer-binding protein [Culicoides brevitarsis]|uniref:CCAAT/enhancer-binding protein n=1 Tax=Culicoides brevitarsis TaxID=469753 RepID=UPI00307BFBA9
MDSPPQMYDNTNQSALSQNIVKKSSMAASANNNNISNNNNNNTTVNNNNPATVNQNTLALKQQQAQQLLQNGSPTNNGLNGTNLNSNLLLQKQMLQQMQYGQGDLDDLTSQEISLDLQNLIEDQFRDGDSLGVFAEMVSVGSTNGILPAATTAAKVLQLQSARQNNNNNNNNNNSYRSQLAYMPQPVHTGATYNNSSDENSSVGSDSTTVKEEPVDPIEMRRQAALAAANGNGNAQFVHNGNGLYQNYNQNGNNNNFTNLTPTSVLHHQGLPHIPGAHLANLKHKQLLPNGRKQQQKNVDKGTDEYRRRRERNNIAVRKSREKAKVRSREVEEKVKALLKEKDALVRRLEEMSNEVHLHKQIYMHLMSHSNPEIKQICSSVLNLVNMSDHGM